MKVLSACPLDCPDACSLEVTVENGRVTKLDGARDRNPVTEGYICAKVRKFPDQLYGKERMLEPMQRVGEKGEGVFEPLSWQQALSLAAKRLIETRDRFGGEAILPYSYGGSNGYLSQDTTDALLFRRLGASRLARTVCAAATGTGGDGPLRQDGGRRLYRLPGGPARRRLGLQSRGVGNPPGAADPGGLRSRRQAGRRSIRAPLRSPNRPIFTWRCARAPISSSPWR